MIRSQARLAEEQPHFPMRQGARIVRRKAGSPAHGHAPIHRPQVRRRRAASVMPRSRHRSRMAMQLVAPMLLFLTLVFQLWVRVGILESGYMLESRRQEAVNKDAEVRRLRSEIATLTTPRNLVQRAKRELGMGLPLASNIRKIEAR